MYPTIQLFKYCRCLTVYGNKIRTSVQYCTYFYIFIYSETFLFPFELASHKNTNGTVEGVEENERKACPRLLRMGRARNGIVEEYLVMWYEEKSSWNGGVNL